ncbi:hypothetical protein BpHYR1_043598 [Brachionus plicatilis]|uniref:Uncharacterized protein n=1 Tax=Brachionus plicatilis TaxID=10195 RepID=A0A3M7T8F9_BRAPC|nr:hypothetical protein BpHYR1_043598 [Brachionus plicatilis]
MRLTLIPIIGIRCTRCIHTRVRIALIAWLACVRVIAAVRIHLLVVRVAVVERCRKLTNRFGWQNHFGLAEFVPDPQAHQCPHALASPSRFPHPLCPPRCSRRSHWLWQSLSDSARPSHLKWTRRRQVPALSAQQTPLHFDPTCGPPQTCPTCSV